MSPGLLIVRIIVVALVGISLVAVVRYHSSRRDLDAAMVRSVCQDFAIPPSEPALRLVDRYLRRTYRFRHSWTWIGIGASFALNFEWKPANGDGWGLAIYPPTSNVILMGLGFWFIGLVRSELYNLRPRYHGSRAASLDVREVRRYLPRRMVVLPRLAAALAVGLVVADRLLPHPSPHRVLIVWFGAISVLVLVLTEACQQGIAQRSRPAVTSDLRAADEAIRRMAAWSVAYGALGLLALLAAFEAVMVSLQPVGEPLGSGSYRSGLGLATTGYGPRGLFVWLGIFLFFGAVGLALQAGRMVQPEPRARRRAATEIAR